ncbi:MAG: hypothetical protein WCO66_01410 [Candidatus Absconditabacteria bacterium]
MKHVKCGFISLILVSTFTACESDGPFGVNDGLVLLQDQKPIKDTLSIVERQQDSLFFWDPGSIEINLPHGAKTAIESADIELVKSENRMKFISKKEWDRTQRDSLSHVSVTTTFEDGHSTVRVLAIKWEGIKIPNTLWQKVTLEPANVGEVSMYPGERCAIEFTWNYPKELRGLLRAEVAYQASTEKVPNWNTVSLEKKRFTASFVYGQNGTARFRITGNKRKTEVSFAVVSIVI